MGSKITLRGNNLNHKPKVTFGEKKANIENISDNEITAIIPQVKESIVDVTVKTDKGITESIKFKAIPSKPPLLTISNIQFLDENGDNVLSAGEEARITFAITNRKGAGKAFGSFSENSFRRL